MSRMVDFIYNRSEIRSERSADGSKHYPRHIKGGDIARMREIADELSPDTKSETRKGWGRATVDPLSQVRIRPLPGATASMPDLHGMGLKDALFLAESRGLRVRFTGSGAVVRQSIAAGTTVRPGTTLLLELENY